MEDEDVHSKIWMVYILRHVDPNTITVYPPQGPFTHPDACLVARTFVMEGASASIQKWEPIRISDKSMTALEPLLHPEKQE